MSIDGEILKLHGQYRRGDVSPLDVTRAELSAVSSLNPGINAFTLIDDKVAIEMAKASEGRYRRGEPLSPLDGITITIKDTLNVAGWPTRRGSQTTSENPASADAVAIARLRAAGAVFIGKTTTPEFAWKGLTQSPLSGVTSSPLDRDRHAGGSSGGGAAATRLDLGVVGVGTDAAGSVRIPAAFCGVVGYKPTFGTIPLDPYASAFWQLPHIGPMTRTVADAALSASVMAGPASSDWMSLVQAPLERRLDDRKWPSGNLRIGVPDGLDRYLEPEVKSAWQEALKSIATRATIEPVVAVPLDEARDIVAALYRLGCAFAVSQVPEDMHSTLDPAILEFIKPVRSLSAEDIVHLQRRREEIASQMALLLATDVDVLLTPTMPCHPPRMDSAASTDVDWFKWCPFTPLFNLTRGPALSLPWQHHEQNALPIGLQVGAGPGNDGLVVAAATMIEAIASQRRPLHSGVSRDAL